MKDTAKLKIVFHESVKEPNELLKVDSFEITKADIFKYGVMVWEVKNKIAESDFEHLQSKIPAFESLLSDFLSLNDNQIFNLSMDEKVKKELSEFVGIACGIKHSLVLFKYDIKSLTKIPPPSEGKYLDFNFISKKKKYELETKGTIDPYASDMVKDIVAKKAVKKPDVYFKYGSITYVVPDKSKNISKCKIIDDPPKLDYVEKDGSYNTIEYYLPLISYIADNTLYNKIIRKLKSRKISKIKIDKNKFFGKYNFENKIFIGEYFDRRLITGNFEKYSMSKNSKIDTIFKHLTKDIGNYKCFIGVDVQIFDFINDLDFENLNIYSTEPKYDWSENVVKLLDIDGILIVISKNGADQQIEKIFTDEVVKSRLGQYSDYRYGNYHACGGTCRSPEKAGKSCEKLTFRTHCHFHR